MTLYLYRIGTAESIFTFENVQSYTADSVTVLEEDCGTVTYAPLAEDCELSSKADCTETLRADWRKANPHAEERLAEMEKQSAATEEQLVQADETAIALYEAQEKQEEINAQQDDALLEIYEMLGQ